MLASASSPAAEEKQEAAPVTHCKGVKDLDKVVLREVRGSSAEVLCCTHIPFLRLLSVLAARSRRRSVALCHGSVRCGAELDAVSCCSSRVVATPLS